MARSVKQVWQIYEGTNTVWTIDVEGLGFRVCASACIRVSVTTLSGIFVEYTGGWISQMTDSHLDEF